MTVKLEYLVFQHLQATCSNPKILKKFCQEANFDPKENAENEDVQENKITIQDIIKHGAKSESMLKKRKKDSDSEESDEEDEEDLTTISAAKKSKIDLSTVECYKCSQTGHMSRECPMKDQPEQQNGGSGYAAQDLSSMTCYNCNKTGHMSKSCPEKFSDVSCYNCGKQGHLSRECPDKASGLICYNCQKPGHLSKDCTEKAGANCKMLCYNCNTVGHMARDCDQPDSRGQGQRSRGMPRGGRNFVRNFGTGSNNMPLGKKKESTSPSQE